MLHVVLMPAADQNAAFAIPLKRGGYIVGRGAACDIVILDDSVSRRHAMLTVNAAAVSITDLRSRNGTFVDDRAVQNSLVRSGQIIRFGEMPYRLAIEDTALLASDWDDETGKRSGSSTGADEELLTPAQRRVYVSLLNGIPEADIAALLGLSVHTVHTHVKAIYAQLGVHSRAELLARRLKARRGAPEVSRRPEQI